MTTQHDERAELIRHVNQVADALCDERLRKAASLLAADGKAGGEVRYCYECGTVGAVGEGKRDCCPDGSHAGYVHPAIAKQAQAGFYPSLETRSQQSAQVAQGWRLVPVEPTEKMRGLLQWFDRGSPAQIKAGWLKVLSASPAAPAAAQVAQPLTTEKINNIKTHIAGLAFICEITDTGQLVDHVVRAVEAAHGIGKDQAS